MNPKDMLLKADLEDALDAGRTLQAVCYGRAVVSGWWIDPLMGVPFDHATIKAMVPTKLMLTVSELSEAMEAHRKGLMDSHIPHRNGVEVELADAVIRIMDLAGALGLDVGAAIAEKLDYNAKRADHKMENRLQPGGKAY